MSISPQSKLVSLFLGYIILISVYDVSIGFFILVSLIIIHTLLYKRIKYIISFLLFMSLFVTVFSFYSVFYIKSGVTLFTIGHLEIHLGAIIYMISVSIRISNLFIFTNIVMMSMSNSQFTYGLEKCLKPLNIFGFNSSKFAITMMISLRFIPVLLKEYQHIKKAQKIRGLDTYSKNPFKMIKSFIPILVPLFQLSFVKANKLAIALDLKHYDEVKKTSQYFEYKITLYDVIYIFLFIFVLFFKLYI